MSTFNEIITAEEEELLQRFYKHTNNAVSTGNRLSDLAKKFRLHTEQLLCSVGFNVNAKFLPEILPILGFATFNELVQERNHIFTSDIYKRLSLDNVLKIYDVIKSDPETLQVMQYLLRSRLEKVESRIEATVNSLIIDKYKAEIRAIYNGGIASIEFAEERLKKSNSGFRALVNEVSIIVESKMIPAGEIFFRDSILPEEKRKLVNKGLIPKELIQSRINDESIMLEEKKVLLDYMRTHRET